MSNISVYIPYPKRNWHQEIDCVRYDDVSDARSSQSHPTHTAAAVGYTAQRPSHRGGAIPTQHFMISGYQSSQFSQLSLAAICKSLICKNGSVQSAGAAGLKERCRRISVNVWIERFSLLVSRRGTEFRVRTQLQVGERAGRQRQWVTNNKKWALFKADNPESESKNPKIQEKKIRNSQDPKHSNILITKYKTQITKLKTQRYKPKSGKEHSGHRYGNME